MPRALAQLPEDRPPASPATADRGRVREVFALFLRLGLTSFGGPLAHTALMEDEVVRRRGWVSREEFLDLVGASQLIPGPNSTELAIHLGQRRAGWAGWAAAGVAFILPAALMVTALAWAYQRYGTLPRVAGVLWGIQPVILAVVLQALWGLGRTALRTPPRIGVAVAALVLGALGVHELVLLAAAALVMPWLKRSRATANPATSGIVAGTAVGVSVPEPGRAAEAFGVVAVAGAGVGGLGAGFSLGGLFLVFLKIGSVLFGSGYVLLAFLRADLVSRLGWISETQLLDAVAAGQVTPGPLFTAATFIGYLLGGGLGAFLATLGIFLPAFVGVAVSGPLVPRIRRSPIAGAVLDGVNVASLALMALVTWQLASAALRHPLAWILAGASALLLVRWRVNSAWLVLGGALVGAVWPR